MSLVIIDNYDSFTYNLYQLVAAQTTEPVLVIPNDALSWPEFSQLNARAIIVSPGPGRPERPADFGISRAAITQANVPLLGVCLGQQGICDAFGGRVTHAPQPMHGRVDEVFHAGEGLFAGLPNPLSVVRYHSLICAEPLPAALRATAHTRHALLMALAHRSRPLWGVQFHPESICTQHGDALLANFLDLAHLPRRTHVAVSSPQAAKHAATLHTRRMAPGFDPAQVFETLYGSEEISVWLDSARSDAQARFSYMAGGPRVAFEQVRYDAESRCITVEAPPASTTFTGDLFQCLQQRLGEPVSAELPFPFHGGFIGYLGYEMKAACGAPAHHRATTPDSVFLLIERFLAFDHATGELHLVCRGDGANAWFQSIEARLARLEPVRDFTPLTDVAFTARQSRSGYLDSIQQALNFIGDGESYEVCLTNQLQAHLPGCDPLAYYQRLRRRNPAPYAAFLRLPELAVACSSPERFLRVTESGEVEAKPIKGTIRRGSDEREDQLLRDFLASDVKSRSENLMIVDLLRNDLGRVCEIGSVTVPGLMQVETYATVHQLVSTITGRLAQERTALHLLPAAFPGGSMTGAPKLRTLNIIDELEPAARGIYSGCLGYLSFNGAADFNIVIRTAVFQGDTVSIGVGGAIVALSEPNEEWEEILLKSSALLSAFGAYRLEVEDLPLHERSLARSA